MAISTRYTFDRSVLRMQDAQTRIGDTQAQLSTGKRIVNASDDADRANTIQRVQSALQRQDNYAQTLTTLDDRLRTQETALNSASDALIRLKELTVQASNDTMGPADRQNIAVELESLKQDLLGLANTRDVNGNYLFGGTRVGAAPFENEPGGAAAYHGDQTTIEVAVGDQRRVVANRAGSDVFTGVVRDTPNGPQGVGFFQVIDDLTAAVRGSDRANMTRALGEVDKLQEGFSGALAEVGADARVVELQRGIIEDTRLRLQSTLSGLQDTDYTEAVTRLNKEMLALEAAQSSFAKTSSLNLFNFLK